MTGLGEGEEHVCRIVRVVEGKQERALFSDMGIFWGAGGTAHLIRGLTGPSIPTKGTVAHTPTGIEIRSSMKRLRP